MRSIIPHALSLLLALAVSEVLSATIHVPSGQPTIQVAINAAVNGDTILVSPGTYFENINFRGKNIVVASYYLLTNDPSFIASTIINGSAPVNADTASCVLIISGETAAAVLDGFTLTGGKGTRWMDEHGAGMYREGGGILTALSAPTIRNNYITGNEAIDRTNATSAGGGGIRSGDGNPTIINNIIIGNRGRYGAGIVLNYTGAKIRNNVIARNYGGEDFGGAGVWVNSNGSAGKIIENNTIVENSAPTNDGGGLLVQSTSVTVRNNIVWGNSARTGPQVSIAPGSAAVFTYCDVQGGYTGIGNIDVAPLFTDTSFYLSAGSPCVDAGNPDPLYDDPPDTLTPTIPRFPSRGTLRNDLGAFGGPGSRPTLYVDLHLNDPRTPSSFRAYSDYQTPHAIALHWVDPTMLNDGSPLTNFTLHIYRGTTLIAEVDSGVQTYVDTGLIQHGEYRYYIRTVIPTDSSVLDSALAYAGGHRQSKPPVLVSLTDASDGIIVSWKNPSRQLDNTPLNDLAFVLLYRDNILFDSLAQSSADTALVKSYLDPVEGFHSYRIRIRDDESPSNFSTLTDSSLAYGKISDRFTGDFENGKGNLFVTGSWDTTSALSASGSHCITDSPTGNSLPGTTTSILLPPVILGSYPALRYSDIAIVPEGGFAIVEISINRRRTFQTLKYYDLTSQTQWADRHADPTDWISRSIDLSAYAGDTATIRFRLIPGAPPTADGWYIDNVYAGRADTAGTVSYALTSSWNMISLPLAVENRSKAVVFPSASSAAFSFEGKYIPQDSMRSGIGYWLKFDSSSGIPVSGRTIPKEMIVLKKGWNLVGSVSSPITVSNISTIPGNILSSAFYTFDSVYKPQTILQPGKAYWIKSASNGVLVLNSLAMSPAPFATKEHSTRNRCVNAITFIDAVGHTKELFLMNSTDESVVHEDLPPLPPEELFDIRFASNLDHENFTAEMRSIPIHFQSVTYPLCVRWNSLSEFPVATLMLDGHATTMADTGSLVVDQPAGTLTVVLNRVPASHSTTPSSFSLHQNYPNPFNPVTTLRYELAGMSFVSLKVFDILGREVATLVNRIEDAGYKTATWDAEDVPSGVYFCRIEISAIDDGKTRFTGMNKMMLLK